MGNNYSTSFIEHYDYDAVVDDNEFDYSHNMENQYIVIEKNEKCQWKSITKWSEISNKDKKSNLKNRNYYFPHYMNNLAE